MQIEKVPIDSLVFDPSNARAHPDKNLAAIKGSLAKFGQQKPLVVDKNNVVIAGNGTLAAAKQLGWAEVDIVRTELTGTEAIAYALSDNRSGELAEWDSDVLSKTLAGLRAEDFDLEGIGFDDGDLSQWLKEAEQVAPGCDEDEVPEYVEPKTKLGDLYQLGEHRLLCGDSTDVLQVERLMAGAKADMVFTDPPYNHAGEEKLVASSVRKTMKDLSKSAWDKDFSFLDVAGSIEAALAKDATVYVCTSWHLAGQIWDWMKERSSYSGYCVWHKPNPMPSLMKRHWTWATELICYATYGKHTFNFPDNGHALNVWTIGKESDGSHPTMKPVELCDRAISHSSNAGYKVLDLFLGSGSTLIACEKTGRKCYGMELDCTYVSVIIERFIKYSGKEVYRLNDDGSKTAWAEC